MINSRCPVSSYEEANSKFLMEMQDMDGEMNAWNMKMAMQSILATHIRMKPNLGKWNLKL